MTLSPKDLRGLTVEQIAQAIAGKPLHAMRASDFEQWEKRPCSCAVPTIQGLTMQIEPGREYRFRCFVCGGLVRFVKGQEAAVKCVRAQDSGFSRDDINSITVAWGIIDDTAKAPCLPRCPGQKIDSTKAFHIGDVIRCLTCGRVAGRVGLIQP